MLCKNIGKHWSLTELLAKKQRKRLPFNHIDETSLKDPRRSYILFQRLLQMATVCMCAYTHSCKISYCGHVEHLQAIYLGLETVLAGKQGKTKYLFQFSHSVVSSSLWPHGLPAHQASQSITNSPSLFKLMSIKLVMPAHYLILRRPLLQHTVQN